MRKVPSRTHRRWSREADIWMAGLAEQSLRRAQFANRQGTAPDAATNRGRHPDIRGDVAGRLILTFAQLVLLRVLGQLCT